MILKNIRTIRTKQSRLTETIRETGSFGSVFSDHMLLAEYDNGNWQNIEIVPYGALPLPPAPIALHYGQSAFEGFKAHRTINRGITLFRPKDNHARLNRAARRLAMPEIPESIFLEGITELVRLDQEWTPYRKGGGLYVRPVYFAVDEELSVLPAKKYRFVVITCPVGPYFGESINLVVEEQYVRSVPGGTGDVKSAGNYVGTLLAARKAVEQGYQNVIWLDAIEHRYVEECGLMNIFFVIDGVAVTPPLNGTILPGITRDSIIKILVDMCIPVEERLISIDEIISLAQSGRLTEAAGVGTAATVVPIGRIHYRDQEIELPIANDSIMHAARLKLEAIRTGQAEDKYNWLIKI